MIERKPMTLGPNVKKLAVYKMCVDVIPVGGGFIDGIKFLSETQNISGSFMASLKCVEDAIQSVREASEPNPHKLSDDETIAGVILEEIQTVDPSSS